MTDMEITPTNCRGDDFNRNRIKFRVVMRRGVLIAASTHRVVSPKWLLIARRANVPPGMVSAVFWELLDYASQEKDRGSVEGFDHETYAGWAGWEERDVLAILDAMRSKGVITADNRLASWEKRQVKREDETGAERQATYRDNKRNALVTRDTAVSNDVTQSNAKSRKVTQKNARLDSDKTRLEETRNGNSVSKEKDHSSNGRGAEDALIDPELAQALAQWKETFTGTPFEGNPPIAQLIQWVDYAGAEVMCYMIGKAQDKENPGGYLYITFDKWRQAGEVAPYIVKAARDATIAARPIITETVKLDYGDGTFGEVEVQTRGT